MYYRAHRHSNTGPPSTNHTASNLDESTHEMVQLRGWKGTQKALFFKMEFSVIQSKLRLVDIGHQQDRKPVGRRKPVLP